MRPELDSVFCCGKSIFGARKGGTPTVAKKKNKKKKEIKIDWREVKHTKMKV